MKYVTFNGIFNNDIIVWDWFDLNWKDIEYYTEITYENIIGNGITLAIAIFHCGNIDCVRWNKIYGIDT